MLSDEMESRARDERGMAGSIAPYYPSRFLFSVRVRGVRLALWMFFYALTRCVLNPGRKWVYCWTG